MSSKIVLAIAILLSSCAKVPIKNTTRCVIAGVWRAGMDCAETLTSETSEKTFEQMIEWLEPQPERIDEKTGKKIKAHAGAVCESAEDFTADKTALEQACALLKNACSPEIKAAIQRAGDNVQGLMDRSLERAQEQVPGAFEPQTIFVPALPVPEDPEPMEIDDPLEAEFIM